MVPIQQGASFKYPIRWYVIDKNTGIETPINLTGATIKCQIRTQVADYETYIHADLSTTNGKIVITDAINGRFKFNVTAEETRAWKFDNAYLEFDIIYANGDNNKISSECQLIREYTR